jgi:ferrochelatase
MTKKGVLLINLGSPDSTAVSDVRKYLREFLMDERVLDVPFLIRWCVVNLAILPTRPKQSAEAYEEVWLPEGSPLVVTSRHVQQELQRRVGDDLVVELAMRYQHPSIESAITNLKAQGVSEVLLFPLFPHYAMSSFETAVVRAQELAVVIAPEIRLSVVKPYYNHPDYIDALVASAEPYLQEEYNHLLFSFHGLPERHLKKSDPTGVHCLVAPECCTVPSAAHATCYRAQCYATVRDFVEKSRIPANKYSVAFQSRLGSDPWLKPYTDYELTRLAKEGVQKMLVICPAFVSDCLETLEEIAMRGKETFLEAGGEDLKLIPCMNEHPQWLEALEKIIRTGF